MVISTDSLGRAEMKWESQVHILDPVDRIDGFKAQLQELGEQGWELVAAAQNVPNYDMLAFLKRLV